MYISLNLLKNFLITINNFFYKSCYKYINVFFYKLFYKCIIIQILISEKIRNIFNYISYPFN